MIVVSDTNILSSLAAADITPLLFALFPKAQICIPPTVKQELQAGLERQQWHLLPIVDAIHAGKIHVIALSVQEQQLSEALPHKLNRGECEAIAIAQVRSTPLLSNDKRAVSYCLEHHIPVLDLPAMLNLLWTQQIVAKEAITALIQKMAVRERLTLTEAQLQRIFAPPTRKR